MENYTDNFCSLDFSFSKNCAWYADISMTSFPIPTKWAEKIVRLFRARMFEKGCHYIDMAFNVWKTNNPA